MPEISLNETNQSLNATNETNSTIWSPDLSMIPDTEGVLLEIEENVFTTLELWGLGAFHTIFTIFLFILGIVVVYYTYVLLTSKSSGIFKYIFYLIIALVILTLLGII